MSSFRPMITFPSNDVLLFRDLSWITYTDPRHFTRLHIQARKSTKPFMNTCLCPLKALCSNHRGVCPTSLSLMQERATLPISQRGSGDREILHMTLSRALNVSYSLHGAHRCRRGQPLWERFLLNTVLISSWSESESESESALFAKCVQTHEEFVLVF